MIERSAKPSVRDWRDWVGLAARLVVGVVLLVAGALKIVNIPAMELAINAYKIFPYEIVKVLAYVVPISELVLGVLLVLGLFTRISAILSGLMFAAFIAGIASAWTRGLSLDCGCFGGGGEIDPSDTKYLEEILRDIGLLALCAWLSIRPRSLLSVDQWLFAVNIPDDPYDNLDQGDTDEQSLLS